ncbi:hypothetical protein WME91_03090 [Sorangium sp. So ce269]
MGDPNQRQQHDFEVSAGQQDGGTPGSAALPTATRRQSAVRILACINAAADDVSDAARWGDEVVAVLRSQSRLQALDFWMRNPDYLANELLNEFERQGDGTLYALAREIVDAREPDLRRLPMVRYRFGAFEPLDDAMAVLRSVDFVRIHREGVPGERVREHFYLLTHQGRKAMLELSALAEELAWYDRRARIVVRVAGGAGGKALKDRQYLQREYATTMLGQIIAPITDRVRRRIDELRGKDRT